MEAGAWLIFSGVNSLLLGIIAALILRSLSGVESVPLLVLVSLIMTAALMGVFHNVLLYYGRRRSIQIENMLPDALQLIAANLRADIPIHKALLLTARAEFGLLARELEILGDEIMSGKSTDAAFKAFGDRVKSPLVTRIATLMEEGLRSGHDVASMLEQVAYDIRVFRILEDEANANIGSYVIFIIMAVMVIAPVLYSISISFIDLSDQVKTTLDVGALVDQASIGGSSTLVNLVAGERGISVDTLIWFAALNLAVSAGIAGILISVLQTGEELQKLPNVPIFIIVAEILFFVCLTVLRTVLGGFFA